MPKTAKKKNGRKLNWEYCECGCHCFEAKAGSLNFQLYIDLKGGYYLGINQWWHDGVKYRSWKDADKAAYAAIKDEMRSLKKAIA